MAFRTAKRLSIAILASVGTLLGAFSTTYAVSIFQVQQGGTGVGTFTSSQLIYGNSTNVLSSVATTTASCSGSTSCTAFTVIGASPVTITSTGTAFPFTPATDFGVNTSATTTAIWAQAGLFASSSTAYPTLAVRQSSTGPAATFDGGNVGIGSVSPIGLFQVQGGSAIFAGANTNAVSAPIAAVEFQTGRNSAGALIAGQTSADTVFEYAAGGFRDFISTRHSSGTGNAMLFYTNNSATAGGSSAPGTGNQLNLALVDGFVGIGTTSPWAQLSINPTASNGIAPSFAIGSSTATNFVVTNAGFVGIGTTTPGSIFAVQDSVNTNTFRGIGNFLANNLSQGVGIGFAGISKIGFNTTGTLSIDGKGTGTAGAILLNTTFGAGAFVGIGTTTPNWLLDVSGTRPSISLSDASGVVGAARWLMTSEGGNFYIGSTTSTYGTSTPAALSILNNGNMGTGTSTPFAQLSVNTVFGSTNFGLFAVGSSTSASVASTLFEIDRNGYITTSGTSPTCDANCTFGQGNANAFRVTTGTAKTSMTITFAQSWGTFAPICLANEGGAGTVAVNASSTPTTVVLTALSVLTAADIEVQCNGIQ